ncbi:hypothetical protein WAF17_17660 [Bernardetia sp. ABR2-2B]|uniref:hypothetical protein n=1 Tax=Bernardetia sp. ABR2-2B TaxID=3127472 RepID=UPI0030CE7B78
MNHFLFVLKTAGVSLFTCSICGILGGIAWDIMKPPHPHVPIPNWIITLVLTACTSLVVSIIVGSALSFLGKANLPKAILYTNLIVVIFLIIFLTYVITV